MTSSTNLAESAGASPKLRVRPSAPPASAVAIPTRKPPNAVAKKTAGKYGVKKTSGRISESDHRAAVDRARQQAANPALKSGEGRDVPRQPRRNSSISLAMRHHTSAGRRIQNKAGLTGKSKLTGQYGLAPQAPVALFPQAGDILLF